MSKTAIAEAYINLLEKGDFKSIIDLFSHDGLVSSPIYGTKSAKLFYKELSADTSLSKLILKGIFEDKDTDRIALYFNYNWTLKSNESVTFDVVDILEFNAQNEIVHLHIIYDTVKSRPSVNAMKQSN